jgi:hypothetical protein
MVVRFFSELTVTEMRCASVPESARTKDCDSPSTFKVEHAIESLGDAAYQMDGLHGLST